MRRIAGARRARFSGPGPGAVRVLGLGHAEREGAHTPHSVGRCICSSSNILAVQLRLYECGFSSLVVPVYFRDSRIFPSSVRRSHASLQGLYIITDTSSINVFTAVLARSPLSVPSQVGDGGLGETWGGAGFFSSVSEFVASVATMVAESASACSYCSVSRYRYRYANLHTLGVQMMAVPSYLIAK